MKVIGAGLPRTATTTQMFALEQLDLGPCYHMRDLLADLESGLPLWEAVAEGSPDWEQIFGAARSTVDWPSARFYPELMEYYPQAKVLLGVRTGEEWVNSMRGTVWGIFHGDSALHHLCEARAAGDPLWRRHMGLMRGVGRGGGGGGRGGGARGGVVDAGNGSVKRAVRAARRLVGTPGGGGDPLCDFPGVPVPAEPLPR